MPIPQISKKNRDNQSWRNRKNKKKYYVSRARNKGWAGRKTRRQKSLSGGKLKKIIILSLLGLFLAGILSGFAFVAWISRGLPDPNKLIDREIAQKPCYMKFTEMKKEP